MFEKLEPPNLLSNESLAPGLFSRMEHTALRVSRSSSFAWRGTAFHNSSDSRLLRLCSLFLSYALE